MLTTIDLHDSVRVLADPLRARIVALLAEATMCTVTWSPTLGPGRPRCHTTCGVLRDAGWVDTEPCGRFTYYRLRPQPLAALADELSALARSASGAADRRRPC